MHVQHLNYNKAENRWVKTKLNNFSYATAQGADLSGSDWNMMDVSHTNFSTHNPLPPDAVQKIEGYQDRHPDLTTPAIWHTVLKDDVDKTITRFSGSTWRNVKAKHADFTGAKMMNMNFPAEIETIDDVQPPSLYQQARVPVPTWPLRVARNERPRLRIPLTRRKLPEWPKKQNEPLIKLPLEYAEYQQKYLVPTDEIEFDKAILKNTDWSGTKLNAISKLTGKVESRLNFEGAILDGADFREAVMLNPDNPKQKTKIRNLVAMIYNRERSGEIPDQIKPFIGELALMFGDLPEKNVKQPKFSNVEKHNTAFCELLSKSYLKRTKKEKNNAN